MFKSTTKLIFLFPIILIGYLVWPEESVTKDLSIDKVVVFKEKRKMEIWTNKELVKTYSISLGKNPTGAKRIQGDSKTPEGIYVINDKNPNSSYHLNLGISYPNEKDKSLSSNPGGDIKIHGLRSGFGFIGKLHRLIDWTDGCIAVTNSEIEELYAIIDVGTIIEIKK